MGSRYERRGRVGSALLALAVVAIALRPLGDEGRGEDGLPPRLPALVTRVIDGDTVEVRTGGGRTEEVRYIGVDTPETVAPDTPVQCFGPRASSFNRGLVEGHRVRLVLGAERRDAYGRLLAYVHLAEAAGGQAGERFVNAALVRRGLARPLAIPPNDRFASRFASLARAAGRRGRGLWGACSG